MAMPVTIDRIVEQIYDGILDEAAWKQAMASIADLVGGSTVYMFCIDPTSAAVLRAVQYRGDPEVLQDYQRHWIYHDTRLPVGTTFPLYEAQFETRLFGSLSPWRRSEIYNEFLAPSDSPWFLCFWLHKSANKVVAFSINGTRRRGAFDSSDAQIVRPLLPHLRRAIEIKDRLELSDARVQSLSDTLDSLQFGIVTLDLSGRLLEANRIAQALVRSGNGIRRNADGTLWLQKPAGAALDHWIHRKLPADNFADGVLQVTRQGKLPLSVVVTPLNSSTISWMDAEPPSWMLLLFDPELRIAASVERIASYLSVTEREAEIATLLYGGYNLAAIAKRLRISVQTVRTHLKSIYSKTDTHSQAELVRRIAIGPAILAQASDLPSKPDTDPPFE